MAPGPVADDLGHLVQGDRWFVDATTHQGIEDVGQGHQSRRYRDGVADKPRGIARAVPFFVVAERDLARDPQKGKGFRCSVGLEVTRLRDGLLHRRLDRASADGRVCSHDLHLVGSERPGLEQDRIRDADLADIVKRRRLDRQLQTRSCKRLFKARLIGEVTGQDFHVELRADDVLPGFLVACLGQVGKGADAEILNQQVVSHTARNFRLQPGIFGRQPIAGFFELELGPHPRQCHDRIDGLGDVIHRTERESQLLALGGVHCGNEDHRDARGRSVGAKSLEHFVTVDSRHHHIQEDEVGRGRRARRAQGTLARISNPHPVERLQQLAENAEVLRRIVDNQDGA